MPEVKKHCQQCLYWYIDCPECNNHDQWVDAKGLFQEVEDQKGTIEYFQDRDQRAKELFQKVIPILIFLDDLHHETFCDIEPCIHHGENSMTFKCNDCNKGIKKSIDEFLEG